MSSPILPAQGPPGPPRPVSADTGASVLGAIASGLSLGDGSRAIEASRGGPPREVLEQVAAAATIHERLWERGRRLRFTAAGAEGRTRIEIHDFEGNVERTLSTAQALEIAAGKPLG